MGGGGGGGGISATDMSKLQQAADERLKAIASNSTHILFACEVVDRGSLDRHLAGSTVFKKDRIAVVDGNNPNSANALIASSTFLVLFTDAAADTRFLDAIVDKTLANRMGGVHAKAQAKSTIPSKVTAYRWRSIIWGDLEKMFQ
jgi:hypothetical protein